MLSLSNIIDSLSYKCGFSSPSPRKKEKRKKNKALIRFYNLNVRGEIPITNVFCIFLSNDRIIIYCEGKEMVVGNVPQ